VILVILFVIIEILYKALKWKITVIVSVLKHCVRMEGNYFDCSCIRLDQICKNGATANEDCSCVCLDQIVRMEGN